MSFERVMLYRKADEKPPPGKGKGKKAAPAPSASFADTMLLVDFNPATLRITLNNQFGDDPPQAHARSTTSKLDCELIFDTTDTGTDVGIDLRKLERFTRATGVKPAKGGNAQPGGKVPVIEFHWGPKIFEGVIESLATTIDYWSSDGVPLRATVQLSMKETAALTDVKERSARRDDTLPGLTPVTQAVVTNPDKPANSAAEQGGNGLAARSIAAMNGMESMRGGIGASAGASVGVSASVNLQAAAGFAASGGVSAGAGAGASLGFGLGASAGASAGAGLGGGVGVGLSAGAGIGGGAGIGIGASAGIGIGASAGAGIGIGASAGVSASAFAGASASAGAFAGASASASAGAFVGGSASAGVSASAGAFAGLGSSKTLGGNTGIDPARFLPPPAPVVIGAGAQFDTTGRLIGAGSTMVAGAYARGEVRIF